MDWRERYHCVGVVINDDVLIAPGAYVNFDVPSDSIVLGNPGKIIHKDNAVEGYIKNIYFREGDARCL